MTEAEIAVLDAKWAQQLAVFDLDLEVEFTGAGFSTQSAPDGTDLQCVFSAGALVVTSAVKPHGPGTVGVQAAGKSAAYRQDLEARIMASSAGNGAGASMGAALKKETRNL
jgi:hypothetical protein